MMRAERPIVACRRGPGSLLGLRFRLSRRPHRTRDDRSSVGRLEIRLHIYSRGPDRHSGETPYHSIVRAARAQRHRRMDDPLGLHRQEVPSAVVDIGARRERDLDVAALMHREAVQHSKEHERPEHDPARQKDRHEKREERLPFTCLSAARRGRFTVATRSRRIPIQALSRHPRSERIIRQTDERSIGRSMRSRVRSDWPGFDNLRASRSPRSSARSYA